MHASRDRLLDHTYRMECQDCTAVRHAELGGTVRESVENGEAVTLYCGRCSEYTRHEDITGGQS